MSRSISLAYEAGQFPTLYEDNHGRLRGQFLELWKIIGGAFGANINLMKINSKYPLLFALIFALRFDGGR